MESEQIYASCHTFEEETEESQAHNSYTLWIFSNFIYTTMHDIGACYISS